MGCDAVVHLGNIPTDVRNTSQAIFENNMLVNFNVLEACKDFKIPKLVWASSETVLGYPFVPKELSYLPVDEEHPTIVKSSYAMAKRLTEILSDMYSKLTNTQIVTLRFANIYEPDEYEKSLACTGTSGKKIYKRKMHGPIVMSEMLQACLLAVEKTISETMSSILLRRTPS